MEARNEISAGRRTLFFRVPFAAVPDLIGGRKVLLRAGQAYVGQDQVRAGGQSVGLVLGLPPVGRGGQPEGGRSRGAGAGRGQWACLCILSPATPRPAAAVQSPLPRRLAGLLAGGGHLSGAAGVVAGGSVPQVGELCDGGGRPSGPPGRGHAQPVRRQRHKQGEGGHRGRGGGAAVKRTVRRERERGTGRREGRGVCASTLDVVRSGDGRKKRLGGGRGDLAGLVCSEQLSGESSCLGRGDLAGLVCSEQLCPCAALRSRVAPCPGSARHATHRRCTCLSPHARTRRSFSTTDGRRLPKGQVTLGQLPALVGGSHFPPCMTLTYERTLAEHHAKHMARNQLTLFLKVRAPPGPEARLNGAWTHGQSGRAVGEGRRCDRARARGR